MRRWDQTAQQRAQARWSAWTAPTQRRVGRRGDDFWKLVVVVRLLFAVIISITVMFLDIPRYHVGLVVTCAVLVAMNAALARMALDRGGLGVLSAWPEAIAIGVWAALLPDQMWAAVTIFAGYFAYVAIAFGRRVVALMSAVCLVPIVVGVVVNHQPQSGAVLSLYVVMSLSAILLIGHAADEATEVRSDFAAMLDALDVVLWDASIDTNVRACAALSTSAAPTALMMRVYSKQEILRLV